MKFFFEPKKVLPALATALGVVPKKTTKPILSNFLFETDKSSNVILRATDESMSFSCFIPEATVEQQGSFCVNAKDFHDCIKSIKKNEAVECVVSKDDTIKISSGKTKFSLNLLPRDEFPKWGKDPMDVSFDIKVYDALHMISKVLHSVSEEETRYYLGGIYLHKEEGESMFAVATDGHRLSLCELDDSTDGISSLACLPGKIIPLALLLEAQKMLENADVESPLTISFSKKQVQFQNFSKTLCGLLVEGVFPNYSQVLPAPQAMKSVSKVNRQALIDAVERALNLSPDKGGGVCLTTGKESISISSKSNNRGSASDEVDCEVLLFEPIEVGFNGNYFIESLKTIKSKSVHIGLINQLSPCVIEPFFGEDDPVTEKTRHVVMPMRI